MHFSHSGGFGMVAELLACHYRNILSPLLPLNSSKGVAFALALAGSPATHFQATALLLSRRGRPLAHEDAQVRTRVWAHHHIDPPDAGFHLGTPLEGSFDLHCRFGMPGATACCPLVL